MAHFGWATGDVATGDASPAVAWAASDTAGARLISARIDALMRRDQSIARRRGWVTRQLAEFS